MESSNDKIKALTVCLEELTRIREKLSVPGSALTLHDRLKLKEVGMIMTNYATEGIREES